MSVEPLVPSCESRERGFSLLEAVVAMALTLVVMIGAYATSEWALKSLAANTDDVNARSTGRAVLDLVAADIRVAGYNPLGRTFDALPTGTATTIRLVSDRNGNGVVGTAGQTGENITWMFVGPDGSGTYDLRRGVDLDGDGSFSSSGESIETAVTGIVQVDADGDGTLDPFFAFDSAPPYSKRIRLTAGIRNANPNPFTRVYKVVTFRQDIALRNTLLR